MSGSPPDSRNSEPSLTSSRTPSHGKDEGDDPATVDSDFRKRSPSLTSDSNHTSISDTPVILHQERQRISLRAFLRTLLQDRKIASSKQIQDFLTARRIPRSHFNAEERLDMKCRRRVDRRRFLEQRRFYELAHEKAKELDSYMSEFRRSIVDQNGLSRFFGEIKEKNSISEMGPEYQKLFEWLRVE